MEQHTSVSHPVAKIVSLAAAVGISSWSELAAAAAFVYSLLLIAEWIYNRFIKRTPRGR